MVLGLVVVCESFQAALKLPRIDYCFIFHSPHPLAIFAYTTTLDNTLTRRNSFLQTCPVLLRQLGSTDTLSSPAMVIYQNHPKDTSAYSAVVNPDFDEVGGASDVPPTILHTGAYRDGSQEKVDILNTGKSTIVYRSSRKQKSTNTKLSFTVVIILALLSLAVIIWLITHILTQRDGVFLEADIIGGSFTVTEAKLIDLVSSVLIAPLIIAVANFYIFSLIRCCTLDERSPKGGTASLETLIEVGGTDWGSYSPFKHYNLLKPSEPRLAMLSIVALSAALSFSLLSNVIAYEVTGTSTTNEQASLNYLYAAGVANSSSVNNTDSPIEVIHDAKPMVYPNMTTQQAKTFTTNLFQSLASLSDDPSKLLHKGAYINLNVSDSSLNNLPASLHVLLDVPQTNMTYKCEPSEIHNVSMGDNGASQLTLISINASSKSNSKSRPYFGRIRDLSSFLLGDFHKTYRKSRAQPLVAFSEQEVWLGMFEPQTINFGGVEVEKIDSPFGTVPKFTHNNTDFLLNAGYTAASDAGKDDDNDMRVLNFFGITCTIMQRNIYSLLSRVSNNSAGSTDWYIVQGSYNKSASPPDEDQIHRSILSDIQASFVFSQTIVAELTGEPVPGLGAALTQARGLWINEGDHDGGLLGVNFEKFADAFLFLEGEATVAAYQVAQESASNSTDMNPSFTVEARGHGEALYSITYVPWVLLAGLICIFLAAGLTLGLAACSFKTTTFRQGRILTSLRVAMDVGSALDQQSIKQSRHLDDGSLNGWAKKCRFRYKRQDGEVVLNQVEDS